MYDRRSGWVNLEPFLFDANFSDLPIVEIQVNPEFGSREEAKVQAERFAPVIGRLPKCLRTDLETVWIHRGMNPFGGGNNNLLIHTEQADDYEQSGILEETLVHEAAHTSLDGKHAYDEDWLTAQERDGRFISTYARDNPFREDVAESFLPYFAVRYRSDRISQSLSQIIEETIPHRIVYFDAQKFELFQDYPRIWDNAEDLGNGWKHLLWLGTFFDSGTNWFYFPAMGWFYPVEGDENTFWLYLSELDRWLWTSPTLFPLIFEATQERWLFFRILGQKMVIYKYESGLWTIQ